MNNSDKLKVIVITQQDGFFIPTNIIKASKVCNIVEVVDNHAKSSVGNKVLDLIKWFGIFQCTKMGMKTYSRKIQDFVDSKSKYKKYKGTCSIKSAADYIGADFKVITNLNSKNYVDHVRSIKPDLIISYSAPQIIKPELLSIPKYGILNVHGALLPSYRGCLPSFWYLYNNEKMGGATVHFMSSDIDDGDICVQKKIDISNCKTMFQLMKLTKLVGGDAMVEAIQRIENGTLEVKKNDTKNGSYYTWPTIEEAKEFNRSGKRLI